MKILDKLQRRREGSSTLVGKFVQVASFQLRVDAVIGEGGFATIYRASETRSAQTFALKHFRFAGNREARASVRREVETMQALADCPQVLHVRAFQDGANEAYVLLDLCRSNLMDYVSSRGPASIPAALDVFESVCRAVRHMHEMNPPLAHRDLKAENVLLHPEGKWVLCDFGSCSSFQGTHATAAAMGVAEDDIRKHTTPAYRAPEQWDLYARQHIGTPVDVWALGCLLYFLCSGRLPFDGDAKLQILTGRYQALDRVHPDVATLIAACLRVSPLDRPSAGALVSAVSEMRQGGDSATIVALLASPQAAAVAPAPPPAAPPAVATAVATAAAIAADRAGSGGVPVALVAPGSAASSATPSVSSVAAAPSPPRPPAAPATLASGRPSPLPSAAVASAAEGGATAADQAGGVDDSPLVALPPDDVREETPPSLLDDGAGPGAGARPAAAPVPVEAASGWASFSSVPAADVAAPQTASAAAFESSGWEAFGDGGGVDVASVQPEAQPAAAFSQDGEWSAIGASAASRSGAGGAGGAEVGSTAAPIGDAGTEEPEGALDAPAPSDSSESSGGSQDASPSRASALRTRVEELEERCRDLESKVEVKAMEVNQLRTENLSQQRRIEELTAQLRTLQTKSWQAVQGSHQAPFEGSVTSSPTLRREPAASWSSSATDEDQRSRPMRPTSNPKTASESSSSKGKAVLSSMMSPSQFNDLDPLG